MAKIWRNGLFLPEDQAVLSVYDSGVMYGDMVFEMCRSFNKQLFKVDQHVNRLLDSIKYTQMPCAYNFHQLKMAHQDVVFANRREFRDDDEYRTLINVSRGPLPIYEAILEQKPWVMVSVYPLRWVLQGVSQFYASGVPAYIPSQLAIPSRFQENKIKHHARITSRLADLEVRAINPKGWSLLKDDDGFITEGTGSNFFIVQRDRLVTPEPRNCLRGISRNFVFTLARSLGLEYRERNIDPFDVATASEAFFTATPWCMMPCTSLNGRPIGTGKVGYITQLLIDKWIQSVDCDFVEQARRWDANRTIAD